MVPSLPTLSIASAMISPMVVSQLAETVATCAISVRSLTFLEILSSSATMASTALSDAALERVGFAPAVTLRRPSRRWPRRARSRWWCRRRRCRWSCWRLRGPAGRPCFRKGSSSSISLATVTPSLVIVGLPNFLSRMTLRPLGPRVALTALASFSTPRRSACRAFSSNSNCFAAIYLVR